MAEDSETGRKLRHKERKLYSEMDIDEDEIEGKRNFSLEEKLTTDKYNDQFVKELKGTDVNVKYFQEKGFSCPIVVKDKSGLGMRMPSENFKVSDVKQCVGSRRQLDVMDVKTQKGLELSMKEWVKYYENPNRDRLLNVISLEFSHTRLENYVEQPEVVRQLDWVDTVWPRYLKECHTEATNIISKMKYPKVQKYCLMSVKGCYTDFHIDMGGTSVWYHILHGKKIFWLIPPTEKNIELYVNWTLSGKQGDIFFADQAEKCQRIELEQGWTFFIPTGWIHGVYTPVDSLVFGGNFLHSYNIPMQFRTHEIEERTRVPQKFRYPFLTEMLWYVLERYVGTLTGRHHRVRSEEEIKDEKEDEKDILAQLKAETASPADSGEDEVPVSRRGRRKSSNTSQDDSPPRSPVMEEHSYVCSARPFHPKSPQSPHSQRPGSPKGRKPPSGDENSAPRSPKTVLSEPKSPKTSASKVPSAAPNRSGQSDPKIKTYFNQSDLIKPVSVKLENCLLAPEHKGLIEGATKKPSVHLTSFELQGLSMIVDFLVNLPPTKKNIPRDIPDSDGLLEDARKMLLEHSSDDHKSACTGDQILKWPTKKIKKVRTYTSHFPRAPKGSKQKYGPGKEASGNRRRRVRCKNCEPCTRHDCRQCGFCIDMRKYGGPGKMKQSCIARQCLRPVLPTSALCILCEQCDIGEPDNEEDISVLLMECGICWEIVHPKCLHEKNTNLTTEGTVNEDLPNSWECPKCSVGGKHGLIRPRVIKTCAVRSDSRASSTSSEVSAAELKESEGDTKISGRDTPSSTKSEKLTQDGSSPTDVKDGDAIQRSAMDRVKETPSNRGRETPPVRGRETPPSQETPPTRGRETPPTRGRQTPPTRGRETPPTREREIPPTRGRETPPARGRDTPPVRGRETPPTRGIENIPVKEKELLASWGKESPLTRGRNTPPVQGRDTPPTKGTGRGRGRKAKDDSNEGEQRPRKKMRREDSPTRSVGRGRGRSSSPNKVPNRSVSPNKGRMSPSKNTGIVSPTRISRSGREVVMPSRYLR